MSLQAAEIVLNVSERTSGAYGTSLARDRLCHLPSRSPLRRKDRRENLHRFHAARRRIQARTLPRYPIAPGVYPADRRSSTLTGGFDPRDCGDAVGVFPHPCPSRQVRPTAARRWRFSFSHPHHHPDNHHEQSRRQHLVRLQVDTLKSAQFGAPAPPSQPWR